MSQHGYMAIMSIITQSPENERADIASDWEVNGWGEVHGACCGCWGDGTVDSRPRAKIKGVNPVLVCVTVL